MKVNYLYCAIIANLFFVLPSCKKEAKDTAAKNAGSISMSGTWIVNEEDDELYFAGINKLDVDRGAMTDTDFRSVIIDSKTNTAVFTTSISVQGTESYTNSTSSDSSFITFPKDPFRRSVNSKILVVKVSATSMIWLAADTKIFNSGAGPSLYDAYMVTFTKH